MEKVNALIRSVLCISVALYFLSLPTAYATDCEKPVQYLEEGTKAPCHGFLFSPKAESDAYKAKTVGELREEQNKILEERLQLYVKQSETLSKELARKKSTEDFVRVGAFVLGAVITGFIAKNVQR